MNSETIVQAWIHDLQEVLKNEPLTVDDVRIGVFYTAARLPMAMSEWRLRRAG